MHKSFAVKGVSSEESADELESILTQVTGVEEVNVDFSAEKVKVKFDDSKTKLDNLKNEVRAAGYEVS